jgi:hypothetical protein
MIFAFAEDGMVAVLDDLAAARRECACVDVADGVFVFYADDGSRLRPCFPRGSRRRVPGTGEDAGEYLLEREPSPPADFDAALAAAAGLQPNAHFASLDAVRAHVDAVRAALAPYLSPGA